MEAKWLTKTIISVYFEMSPRVEYFSGQFLSVVIPTPHRPEKSVKRAYSFASSGSVSSSERILRHYRPGIHELCVKYVPHGIGSEFLSRLKIGDQFTAFAPYGDFLYKPPEGRKACFIATGSGLGPFRCMILSSEFQENPPEEIMVLFGARTESEILFQGFFEDFGIKTVIALTQPSETWSGFRGRVTDYLKSLPNHWDWHNHDYYLCGNSAMVTDVVAILKNGHGVSLELIHQEVFFKSKGEQPSDLLIA